MDVKYAFRKAPAGIALVKGHSALRSGHTDVSAGYQGVFYVCHRNALGNFDEDINNGLRPYAEDGRAADMAYPRAAAAQQPLQDLFLLLIPVFPVAFVLREDDRKQLPQFLQRHLGQGPVHTHLLKEKPGGHGRQSGP